MVRICRDRSELRRSITIERNFHSMYLVEFVRRALALVRLEYSQRHVDQWNDLLLIDFDFHQMLCSCDLMSIDY